MEKRAPENTTKRVHDDPMSFLAAAAVMGSSNAIEHSEARGQSDFVGSDTLPTDCRDRAILEKAGVRFGQPVKGDPIFSYVELPEGWKKKPTDHSMWSHLVDDKGRERAGIFYKAAFYDRSAHMSATRRYSYGSDYDQLEKLNAASVVKDCGKIIFSTPPVAVKTREAGYEALRKSDVIAEAWLIEHFPNWEDASAYWD